MDAEPAALYEVIRPSLELGLPYIRAVVGSEYHAWPKVTDLLPTWFPGVKTSLDEFLVSIDRDLLEQRLKAYFDLRISGDVLRSRFPIIMTNTAHFDASKTREDLCRRGWHPEQVVRYAYRPFDIRWLYWDAETDLLDRSRPDYMEHVLQGNLFLSAGARNRKEAFYQPQIAKDIADHHLVESNVGTRPGKAAFLSLDNADWVRRGAGYAASRDWRARFQFHGRSSSIRLAG